MALLGPEFIDITWNAGGITSDLTIEVSKTNRKPRYLMNQSISSCAKFLNKCMVWKHVCIFTALFEEKDGFFQRERFPGEIFRNGVEHQVEPGKTAMYERILEWWAGWMRRRNLERTQEVMRRSMLAKKRVRLEINRDILRIQRQAARRMNH